MLKTKPINVDFLLLFYVLLLSSVSLLKTCLMGFIGALKVKEIFENKPGTAKSNAIDR